MTTNSARHDRVDVTSKLTGAPLRDGVSEVVDRSRFGAEVLGTFVDAGEFDVTAALIGQWASARRVRSIYFCNVHSLMTARHDKDLARALAQADLVCPDGAPVAWSLRRRGFRRQKRVSGPDIMWAVLQAAERDALGVYFYGAAPETLERLQHTLARQLPKLSICGATAPPFRTLTEAEVQADLATINQSGARLLFVALGCPKQEKWIAEHVRSLSMPVLGVGAAFTYHAGMLGRGPRWMQRNGLEWLFRLVSEPRRLWKRYLYTNTAFLFSMVVESLSRR